MIMLFKVQEVGSLDFMELMELKNCQFLIILENVFMMVERKIVATQQSKNNCPHKTRLTVLIVGLL